MKLKKGDVVVLKDANALAAWEGIGCIPISKYANKAVIVCASFAPTEKRPNGYIWVVRPVGGLNFYWDFDKSLIDHKVTDKAGILAAYKDFLAECRVPANPAIFGEDSTTADATADAGADATSVDG